MHQTASQKLIERVRDLILEGNLKAGERLKEFRVAKLIGASRTPAKVALRALASEGLLTYTPNCGYEVSKFTLDHVIETYQIRAELEALACSIVANTEIDHDTITTLQNCLKIGDEILNDQYLHEKDRDRYREMNRIFHDTIIRKSGNNRLMAFVQQTNNIPLASNRMVVWSDHFAVKRSHDDHHRIYYALIHNDSIRAKALMHEHVRYAGEYLQIQLKKK